MATAMYAAAMWEFQRHHYDHDWARAEGLSQAIVQGPLLGNYLVETLDVWSGGVLDLSQLAWRHHAVAHVDEELTCGGAVTPPGPDRTREAVLWIRGDRGETKVTATARLRRRPAAGNGG